VWFVRTPWDADRDERHPVGARNGATPGLRIEPDEGALRRRHVLAVDAPVARSTHDDGDLFLAGRGLVVLAALGVWRELEPVDAERLDTERTTHEPDGACGPGRVDIGDVSDGESHEANSTDRREAAELTGAEAESPAALV
jgi:hypothetical protein